MGSSIRLADVLGGLSIVADMGFGLPPLQAMRAALVSTALARRLGVDEEDERAAFYAPLLMHIGCISMSHETAAIFGNELAITRAVAMTNLADPDDIVATLVPEATRDLKEEDRLATTEAIASHTLEFGKHYDTTSAEVARRTAGRIGLPDAVALALYQSSETWHGDGAPGGLKGEEITIAARITRIASDAAFFHNVGGIDIATEAVKARSGTLFDPGIAAEFVRAGPELLADAASEEPGALLLEREPRPVLDADQDGLAEIATAYGDAADLKTPYTHGHSRATAEVVARAAEHTGVAREANLSIAAALYDVGRVGVSDAIWDKPGPLNSAEWEQVRMHAYHAERILSRSSHLEPLARVVGMHHERLDGSGYHRGSRSKEIVASARLIAVADAWVSMQQPRPHRPALDPDQAARELSKEAADGKLDAAAVDAVLASSGHAVSSRRKRPGGLTEREVEVLRLVAWGCSNPEIATQLHISPRTAEHHVQHIYTKIGVSTRPAAALFALENELLEPIGA